MTLDRKDYKSAIPQLEKRISQIEQVGEKGLANFDVLKASLEKEIRVRTQALLKTNERVEYAITSADGKNTIYHSASKPTGGEYKGGDTWFDASHGYAIYTWDENVSDWVKEELGEDAIANLAITNAKIANGTIQSAKIGTLDAGKITSGDIASARLQTNVVSAINATVNQIDAKNINVDGTLIVGASDVASAIDDIDVGGRNLLRGTATLANGSSGWSSGHWRASGSGGTIAYAQTITNPPVTGVKGITITPTSANTQVGFVQDSVPLSKREITQSVWVKGKSGDKIDLQPIWSGTSGQEEYGSQRYTLEDSNWHKLTYTKTPNYDHSSVSAGYVYLYAVDTSGARQFIAPQLEYGNKCSDWSTAKEDVDADVSSASKVATNYLSVISGTTGISVHDANDTSNFANLNSNGMTVYKGGADVASFGDTARIGEEASYHSVIEADDFSIMDGDETVFEIDSNGGTRQATYTKLSQGARKTSAPITYTKYIHCKKNTAYTFTLYAPSASPQIVTKTFTDTSQAFTLTGTFMGSTNTIDIRQNRVLSSTMVEIRIARIISAGDGGYARWAPFDITYTGTYNIPMLNIGGITYTEIGRVVLGGYEADTSITDIPASANTSYTLGSIELDAGVWVVAVRARFTPSASGAHVSQITISYSSTPTSTALDRLYAESTYFNQHNATFVLMPKNDEPLTYYVHGTATVAGTWNRTSDPAFSIRAVKIR